MRYMNMFDIESAAYRFNRDATPNRAYLADVVYRLALWANDYSDGWAYWPKPARAADKAMALVESTTNQANREQERVDATDAEVTAALRPIKSFLTRQGVKHEEIL